MAISMLILEKTKYIEYIYKILYDIEFKKKANQKLFLILLK